MMMGKVRGRKKRKKVNIVRERKESINSGLERKPSLEGGLKSYYIILYYRLGTDVLNNFRQRLT